MRVTDSQLISSLYALAQHDSGKEENPVEEYSTFMAAERIEEIAATHDRLIELLVKVSHGRISLACVRDDLLLKFPEDYARIFAKMSGVKIREI